MREIGSTNDKSEARLAQALRSLAASAGDAPPQVGDALAGVFRRHHVRRRVARRATLVALAACMVVAAVLWHRKPSLVVPGRKAPATAAVAPPSTIAPAAPTRVSDPRPKTKTTHPSSRKQPAPQPDEFVALSSYGQPLRGEELRVIRLEVTGRTLRLVGAPVVEELEDRRVLADFVIGQDGTPYGVRLVR